jgi:drug/metabolite transporter (DMT)-like permease
LTPREAALRGSLYMVGSALAFSAMSVAVKLAGQRLPSQEIVLARAVVSLVLSYGLLRRAGIPIWGQQKGLLLLRGLTGFLGLSCVFYSLTHLPLADATVIQYLHPTFTALFAAIFLGEALRSSIVFASFVSLMGVVLVAKPGFLLGTGAGGLPPLALAAAVGGAFFSGCAYVIVRKLSAREHPLVIVLYFPLVSVPLSLPTVANGLVMPEGFEWGLLLFVGCATQAGQVWLTRGLQTLPAARATAISYSQVIFATLWGVLFFAEIPDLWTAIGAALIAGGTLAVSLQRG